MAVVIVGNSGAARECYWLLRMVQERDDNAPPFKGFLAWRGFKGELCELEPFALGNSDEYIPDTDDQFVIGIGKPCLRMAVYAWLKSLRANFYTLKHPSVYICPSANVGEANIFQRDSIAQANASIGNANFMNGGVVIGHDATIGNGNVFNLHSALSGHVRLGDCNLLAPGCLILEHARVGDSNVFAPYSVVYKGCRDHCLMIGNPALVDKRYPREDTGRI